MGYRVFSDSPSPPWARLTMWWTSRAPPRPHAWHRQQARRKTTWVRAVHVVTSFSANAGEVRTASYVEVMPGVMARGEGGDSEARLQNLDQLRSRGPEAGDPSRVRDQAPLGWQIESN